jgi:hypothetical protein
MIGTMAVLSGILIVVLAFKLRGMGNKVEGLAENAKERLSDLESRLKA